MSGKRIVDFGDYQVIDEGNGLSTITVPEDPKPAEEAPRRKGLIPRFIDWWKGAKVKPVIKVIDVCDPTGEQRKRDPDCDTQPGQAGAVIGVRVDF